MENHLTSYQSVISEIKSITSSGQEVAYSTSNKAMLLTYWNIGKRVVEQEPGGSERAEHSKGLISTLADGLAKELGKSYSKRSLHYCIKFYQCFPDEQTVDVCVYNPNWMHIRSLLCVMDENVRYWYVKEAVDESWSSRTLDRNISTQYYHRLLQTPKEDTVIEETKRKTAELQKDQFELVKGPVIAEFLGFKNEDTYLEGELEPAILSHIRDFLMELDGGFAFVARQQYVVTEAPSYCLDPVSYNIGLKCYALIDLKMGRITHQDVGQIGMYVRMYDDLKQGHGGNPIIRILLYSETDKDIVRYSVLHDDDRLSMSKYLTYLPTKEQLRTEIEYQKEILSIQHSDF